MHRAVLLYLAVLAGCASGPPGGREYHRGTFRPPPPAPVRPGVGLPRYDPHVKPLPPQPNPRPRAVPHTPKTRSEPTIWAATTPENEDDERWRADTAREPVVLGIRLRYPPGTSLDEEYRPTNLCAAKIDRLLRALMPPATISALADKERRCLAYRMYGLCASEDVWPTSRQPTRWPHTTDLWRHNTWEAATRWAATECPSDATTKVVQEAFDAARAKWRDAK